MLHLHHNLNFKRWWTQYVVCFSINMAQRLLPILTHDLPKLAKLVKHLFCSGVLLHGFKKAFGMLINIKTS